MTRSFGRWLGKTDLVVEALCKAIEEMERGLVDAKLGGGIVKKRLLYLAAAKAAAPAPWLRQTV